MANGFTIRLDGSRAQFSEHDWLVSCSTFECYLRSWPDRRIVRKYTDWCRWLLGPARVYVGGWEDNGGFFLDVSIAIPSLEHAEQFGHAHGQRAIYHPRSNACVDLRGGSMAYVQERTARGFRSCFDAAALRGAFRPGMGRPHARRRMSVCQLVALDWSCARTLTRVTP
jgi:hypothetical protein